VSLSVSSDKFNDANMYEVFGRHSLPESRSPVRLNPHAESLDQVRAFE